MSLVVHCPCRHLVHRVEARTGAAPQEDRPKVMPAREKRRRPIRSGQRVTLVVLFLLLAAAQSWATYSCFTSQHPGANDFYSRWANGCALVWSGENPYSEEVTLRTQIGMHGRPAQEGEDLAAYSYPLYALFLFWPLCLIRTYALVQAVWMTAMLYGLLGAVVLAAKAVHWRPPAWLWSVTLVWAVFNYPHARAIILGQMATVVSLALAATLWALDRDRDVLAGALLAVTTVKPQMSFLVVPWVLWWAAWQRRWGVWKGLGAAMLLLAGLSFALVPTWLADFLEGLRRYDVVAATSRHSLTWIATHELSGLGRQAELVGTAAFGLFAAVEAWRGRRAPHSHFLWTTGLLLILTHFVAPRTATTHYSMLLPPLFAWFAHLQRRLGRQAASVIVGIELLLLAVQWIVFATTIEGSYEGALTYMPLPITLLVVQIASRKAAVATDSGLLQP